VVTPLKKINRLVFIMNMHCLFYELESKVCNIIALISGSKEASFVEVR
jgi:hypothetical protein